AVYNQIGAAVPGATLERISGANRYETAEALSQHFAQPGGTVYLATGGGFPDAISAAAAVGAKQAPILLVRPDGVLHDSLKAELIRLAPNRVVILGGTAAVAGTVDAA